MSEHNVSKTVAELLAEYEALWETTEPTYVFDEENKRVNVASSGEMVALVEGIESLFALAKAFEQRIEALKQRTSETGWVGRIERRVTALEEAPNYSRTVISHEARIKTLEAAMGLSSAADSITLSRAQWTVVVGFLDRYSQLATGMAYAISDTTMEDVTEFRAEVDAALALIEQEARRS